MWPRGHGFKREEVLVLQHIKKKTFANNSGWNMRQIATRVTDCSEYLRLKKEFEAPIIYPVAELHSES